MHGIDANYVLYNKKKPTENVTSPFCKDTHAHANRTMRPLKETLRNLFVKVNSLVYK